MKTIAVLILFACLTSTGYSETPWYAKRYKDSFDLANDIFRQMSLLKNNPAGKAEFAPLLARTEVLLTDPEGVEVTVRDVAFTILQGAKLVDLPEGPASAKFIYCCGTKSNAIYRYYVPLITEGGFQKTIEALQASMATSAEPEKGKSPGREATALP